MTTLEKRPIVGIMLGDPTGIGPEVALKLLARPETHQQSRIIVVGDKRILKTRPKSLRSH